MTAAATVWVRGEPVPSIGLGTGQLTGGTCYRAVRCALDLGYRHLDTARLYGNEAEIGRALRDSRVNRDEVFLTTKVWRTDVEPGRVAASVEASLRDLGVDRVDLVLVHWPVPEVPIAVTMAALARARAAGRTRYVGTSNFPPALVREATRYAPVFCNQVEYHPLLAQDAVLAAADELDHLVTAYSPIAQGAVATDPVIARVAEAHGRSATQVALRWLVQQPRVAAVPRTGRPDRLAANLAVFDFALSDDEMKEIDERARSRRLRLSDPDHAPGWHDGDGADDREDVQ